MVRNALGELRRSQVVTTFGPGSIVDFRVGGYRGSSVSVVAAGLEEWDFGAAAKGTAHPQSISEPRLERLLRVRGFRLPPVQPDEKSSEDLLVGVRFPRWLQCPRCDRIAPDAKDGFWFSDPGDARRACPTCSGKRSVYALPVRLVAACEAGHLDDFPWVWWAHKGKPDHDAVLKLVSTSGSGLGSLLVVCAAKGCGASRSLAGSFGENALDLSCRGRRPWLSEDAQCDRRLRAVQRGASNLYFPVLASALSVPPWSDTVQKRLGVYWADLAEKDTPEKRRLLIELLELHEKLGLSLDELADQVEHRIARLDEGADIREDEYARLSEAIDGAIDADDEFQVEAEAVPRQLDELLGSLSRVTRLREVRALRGFTRLSPYGDDSDEERLALLSAKPLDWLPAIELRGEGIFVALPRARVERWEATAEVRQRFGRIDPGPGGEQLRPREVLLHTLAHVLMAELALECGYTYASLRERIYSSGNMAGLLVYTGAPDSEGTLGGLVRQGESARFTSVLLNALRRAEWCANDPLCADGRLTLSDESSVASCHACTLAPETSCERFNRVLDRGLLIGVAGLEGAGYFRPVL